MAPAAAHSRRRFTLVALLVVPLVPAVAGAVVGPSEVPLSVGSQTGSLADVPATSTAAAAFAGQGTPLAAFSAEVGATFAPGREVFLSLVGNPTFIGIQPGPPDARSPSSLAAAFGGGGAPSSPPEANVLPGRGNAFAYSAPLFVGTGVLPDPATRVVSDPTGAYHVFINGASGKVDVFRINSSTTISPIVLDLGGDGVFRPSRGRWRAHPGSAAGPFTAFDVDGDGFPDVTEWTGAGYGLLATSATPQSGRDLVGTVGGWDDGFQHLATFDRNHDGLVSGDELAGLYAWEDANGNGVADAGEATALADLGVQWIDTHHNQFVGTWAMREPAGATVTRSAWDFWPSFGVANRVPLAGSDPPRAGAAPKLPHAFCRNDDDDDDDGGDDVGEGDGLDQQTAVTHAALAAAGVDLPTFELIAVARGGRVLIGADRVGTPRRARLLKIRVNPGPPSVKAVVLPFERLYQVALSARADRALVIGDRGSRLAHVGLRRGKVSPSGGIELARFGVRASGVAGFAGGAFWLTGWRLDGNDAAHEERVWRVGCGGLSPGQSLSVLGPQLGAVRQHYVVGPEEVFVAVGASSGGEELWHVRGAHKRRLDTADSFGGLAAIPGAVVYTARRGGTYSASRATESATVALASGTDTIFYPFLAPGGGAAALATLSAADRTITLHLATRDGGWRATPQLTGYPGQTKLGDGVLVHRDRGAITLVPIPQHQQQDD